MTIISHVVSGFSRTVTVRLKADTTYVYEIPLEVESNAHAKLPRCQQLLSGDDT